jgi:hypothetical protein
MSPMHFDLAGAAPTVAPRRTGLRWGVRLATVLAVGASILSGAIIWLTLSRPLEVAGALAAEDGWHIAIALGRLLAGTAARLAAWV